MLLLILYKHHCATSLTKMNEQTQAQAPCLHRFVQQGVQNPMIMKNDVATTRIALLTLLQAVNSC